MEAMQIKIVSVYKVSKMLAFHVSVQKVPFARLAQSENAEFTCRK